jgi:hypothetical protein
MAPIHVHHLSSLSNINNAQFPNPAHEAWIHQEQLFMSLIIISLSKDILPLVVGLNSSHDLWTTLESFLA